MLKMTQKQKETILRGWGKSLFFDNVDEYSRSEVFSVALSFS